MKFLKKIAHIASGGIVRDPDRHVRRGLEEDAEAATARAASQSAAATQAATAQAEESKAKAAEQAEQKRVEAHIEAQRAVARAQAQRERERIEAQIAAQQVALTARQHEYTTVKGARHAVSLELVKLKADLAQATRKLTEFTGSNFVIVPFVGAHLTAAKCTQELTRLNIDVAYFMYNDQLYYVAKNMEPKMLEVQDHSKAADFRDFCVHLTRARAPGFKYKLNAEDVRKLVSLTKEHFKIEDLAKKLEDILKEADSIRKHADELSSKRMNKFQELSDHARKFYEDLLKEHALQKTLRELQAQVRSEQEQHSKVLCETREKLEIDMDDLTKTRQGSQDQRVRLADLQKQHDVKLFQAKEGLAQQEQELAIAQERSKGLDLSRATGAIEMQRLQRELINLKQQEAVVAEKAKRLALSRGSRAAPLPQSMLRIRCHS